MSKDTRSYTEVKSIRTVVVDEVDDSNTNAFGESVQRAAIESKMKEQAELELMFGKATGREETQYSIFE